MRVIRSVKASVWDCDGPIEGLCEGLSGSLRGCVLVFVVSEGVWQFLG